MKMETSLTAPFRGPGAARPSGPNVQVAAQAPLLQLEELDGDGGRPTVAAGERIAFAALAGRPGARLRAPLRMADAGLRRRRPRSGGDRLTTRPSTSVCSRCSPTSARWRGRVTTTRAIPPCAARSEHLHAYLRIAGRRGRGAAARLRRAPRGGARALRRREPGPHSCPGGGVLPHLPRHAAHGRGASLHPRAARPPARAPARGRRRPASGARPDRRRHHRLRPDRLRPRSPGPLPLLRRARHRRGARARLRRDGGAHPGARRRARGPGSGRTGERARRLHAAAGADAAAADGDRRSRAAERAARGRGPPLLPRPDARELRRARDGRGPAALRGLPARRNAAAPRHGVRGPRRPRRRREQLRRLGRRRAGRRPRRRRFLPARRRGRRPPTGCTRVLSTVALPAERAPDRGRRRAGRRGPGHVRRSAPSPSGPAPTGWSRTRCSAACIR